MNIDVREYFRINPISVHELTLSGDGRDCFLYFSADHNQTCNHDPRVGYEIVTQNAMFLSMYKSIFQDLIDDDIQLQARVELSDAGSPIITWKDGIQISETQFTNYIRRPVWNQFQSNFDEMIGSLLAKVNEKLTSLLRQAKLYYIGAVEPQSAAFRRSGWSTPNSPQIYSDFSHSLGQLWCVEGGKVVPEGEDEVIVGDETLKHSHATTKAEAMTTSFSRNQGGGNLVGKFRIGNNSLVSQDSSYKAGGVNMDVVKEVYDYNSDFHNGKLTYPLYGQNVLDFRTRDRCHNNVPPSTNVHVRYFEFNEQRAAAQKGRETEQASTRQVEQETQQEARSVKQSSGENASEPQYESMLVLDLLDDYTNQDLTDHDYLLRMSLDEESGQVKIMKQTVQMLLDIFADDAEVRLGRFFKHDSSKGVDEYVEVDGKWTKNLKTFVNIAQIFKKILDVELVQKIEFSSWYNRQIEVLAEIQTKVDLIKELIKSMKPMNYAGRIIISVTDDTEQKVVANYGGRKWRRITNFLRGVPPNDSSQEVGEKTGEEYVCLRQSNVPIHSHKVTLSEASTTNPAAWMVKGRGGSESRIVNGTETKDDHTDRMVGGLDNAGLEYQISSLEYEERSQVTLPHDNMPPYKEVYIWECLEATKEEMQISGEPAEASYVVTWDENGGSPHEPQWTGFSYGQTLGSFSSLPVPGRTGYTFQHWSDKYGGEVSQQTAVTGDATYTAQWKLNSHTVRFYSNGGRFPGKTGDVSSAVRKYGQTIGKFPKVERESVDDGEIVVSYELAGWLDGRGEAITADRLVHGNIDCYAQWRQQTRRYITVELNANNGDAEDSKTKRTLEGNTIGKFYQPTMVGHSLCGWFTEQEGGVQVHEGTVVSDDSTFYAHWTPNTYSIIWSAQNGKPTEVSTAKYGDRAIDHVPANVERPGYTLVGWYSQPSGGQQMTDATLVTQNATYYAHWTAAQYVVTFDPNAPSEETQHKTVRFGQAYGGLPNVSRTGYNLTGWFTLTTDDGDKIEEGTPVGIAADHTLYAHWTPRKYTITWDSQGGYSVQPWTVDYGSVLGNLPTPAKEGSVLVGWFTDPSGGTQIDRLTQVAEDATYYAHWEEASSEPEP